MEIKITKVENKKDVLDEATYIATFYKQYSKGKLVTKKMSTSIVERIFLLIALFLVVLGLCITDTNYSTIYVCFGIILIAEIKLIEGLIAIHNRKKQAEKKETDSILKIDENEVYLDNRTSNFTYKQPFDDIKMILISKYCISFIPNYEKNIVKTCIVMGRDYEEEILKALKKVNKEHLVVRTKNA